MVAEYRDARDAWVQLRETGDRMQMEDEEYRAVFPPPTFKQWLIGRTGPSVLSRTDVESVGGGDWSDDRAQCAPQTDGQADPSQVA